MDFTVETEGARAEIEVRESTDSWGPFTLDLTNGIPSDQSITGVSVKAYAGKLTKAADRDAFSDITSLLIETSKTAYSGKDVYLWFQYPGEAYRNTKATVIVTATLTDGGVFPFFFYPVKIY